jgi:4-alpha-glucanotransferase
MAEPTTDDHETALAAWGIDAGYHDAFGAWRSTRPETVAALRVAMGGDDHDDRPPRGIPLQVVRRAPDVRSAAVDLDRGLLAAVDSTMDLVLEDGTRLDLATGSLPRDLPYGFHRIEGDGATCANLIVSPGRCALAPGLHTWGVVAQLYAAWSASSWGMGDMADLARIVRWATSRGAGVVGLNPLHAPTPSPSPANSPYSPSTRRWRDPIYLAIEAIPGAEDDPQIAALAAEARALDGRSRIDRAAVWKRKLAALECLWPAHEPKQAWRAYCRRMGEPLLRWSLFCTMAERFGSDWRAWPPGLRRPGDPRRRLRSLPPDLAARVPFWSWLQYLLDRQWAATGAPDVAIADLAVGIAPDGFDAWEWQDLLAEGVTVGAPPDLLGPDGQDWGLPPFVPWRLRDAAYRPLAETLRASMRDARGLRIDHVMGLFRLFWIPSGGSAARGAYVRSPGHELLDVVALESHRAGAVVVGEDLGTVEEGVRDALRDAGVLSTRLLWFEDDPPSTWPRQAMAAVTTHDLPTVRGVWTGVDLDDQQSAGVPVQSEGDNEMRHRLRVAAGADDDAPVQDVVVAAHHALASSLSMIVTATLDDLLGAEHRPNLPGTIDQHPNWRIPLPRPLAELDGDPVAEAIAQTLGKGRHA